MCVCVKIFFSKTPMLALHIRENGIPAFPPAKIRTVTLAERAPSSLARNLVEIKAEEAEENKSVTNYIVFNSVGPILASFLQPLCVNRIHNIQRARYFREF